MHLDGEDNQTGSPLLPSRTTPLISCLDGCLEDILSNIGCAFFNGEDIHAGFLNGVSKTMHQRIWLTLLMAKTYMLASLMASRRPCTNEFG